jgi:hypothetical protein
VRLVIACLLSASLAFAEPGEAAERRTTKVAFLASILVTAGGIGLMLIGADAGIRPHAYGSAADGVEIGATSVGAAATLVGPSIGSLYAENFWNLGFLLRCVAVQIFATGAAVAYVRSSSTRGSGGPDGLVLLSFGIGAVLGAVSYLVGTVIELWGMPKAIDQYNLRHGWAITPTALRSRDGLAPGLALTARF